MYDMPALGSPWSYSGMKLHLHETMGQLNLIRVQSWAFNVVHLQQYMYLCVSVYLYKCVHFWTHVLVCM